ncbi:MAG: putative high affinity sulfate transporter, sulfate permease family [Chlamydiota bacterium]
MPFMEELRGYTLRFLGEDVLAAIAVALMTVPQSIAYSLLAGLPPTAGLFSAIFGTIFTASLGSSRVLVSGPSTGTAILIQTSIADVLYTYYEGVTGAQQEVLILQLLTQLVLVIGLIQIGAAFLNVSKLLQFVSRSVILGYFGGITVAIGITQLFAFLGVPAAQPDLPILYKATALIGRLGQVHIPTLLIGALSLTLFAAMRHWFKNWPYALIMLVAASIGAALYNQYWPEGSLPIATLSALKLPSDPSPHFMMPWFDLKVVNRIFPAAIAISLLGILEVFSIARGFGVKMNQKIQVNQDVLGLGLGNLVLSLIRGAMPSSGSATRTALNYRLRAHTRVAAVLSGILTALFIFACWQYVQYIPLAALAALLIATVNTLTDIDELKLTFRATKEDAWVFVLTFVSCLLFNLDVAFFIGIVISIGSYLRKTSTPHLVEYAFNSKGRLMVVSPKEAGLHKVRIIGIGGDLYFASADVFQVALQSVIEDKHVQAIVLRLNNVYHMDASMCLAILHLYDLLQSTKRHLVISGLTEEVWHVFHRTGLVKKLGLDNLYFTDESNPQFSTWKAVLRAQELVSSAHLIK